MYKIILISTLLSHTKEINMQDRQKNNQNDR